MTMVYGTDEGFLEPGLPGQTNPFPFENLHAVTYRRLYKTRRAMLQNATYDVEPQVNDVVSGHRSVYTSRQAARHPRVLAAFHPGAGTAYGGDTPTSARGASTTITDGTGKAITSPGDLSRGPLGAISSVAGAVHLDLGTGRSNEIACAWLSANDSDLTTLMRYAARLTDANNYIALHRQAAGNLRVERNVASAVSTERDVAIPTTTPASGNAYGLRLSGTSASVFLNGVKLDEWTLNAAAQGLTGTRQGQIIPAGAHVYGLVSYFEAWSLTPVGGV